MHQNQQRRSFNDQNNFSQIALSQCGFESVKKNTLMRQIYNTKPTGKKTHLYDSLIMSLQNIQALHLMMEQSKKSHLWNITLIVLVDGIDKGSKSKWSDVVRIFNTTKNALKVHSFKIAFVSYNISIQQYTNLSFLAELDFQIVQLYFSSFKVGDQNQQRNLGTVMKMIRSNSGILEKKRPPSYVPSQIIRVQQAYGAHHIQYCHAVLFTLSGHQRFQGQSWKHICNSMNVFGKYLNDNDIIGSIIYTEQCYYFMQGSFHIKTQAKSLPKKTENKIKQPQPAQQINNEQFFRINNSQKDIYQNLILCEAIKKNYNPHYQPAIKKMHEGFYLVNQTPGACRKICSVILVLVVIVFIGAAIFAIVQY